MTEDSFLTLSEIQEVFDLWKSVAEGDRERLELWNSLLNDLREKSEVKAREENNFGPDPNWQRP